MMLTGQSRYLRVSTRLNIDWLVRPCIRFHFRKDRFAGNIQRSRDKAIMIEIMIIVFSNDAMTIEVEGIESQVLL